MDDHPILIKVITNTYHVDEHDIPNSMKDINVLKENKHIWTNTYTTYYNFDGSLVSNINRKTLNDSLTRLSDKDIVISCQKNKSDFIYIIHNKYIYEVVSGYIPFLYNIVYGKLWSIDGIKRIYNHEFVSSNKLLGDLFNGKTINLYIHYIFKINKNLI